MDEIEFICIPPKGYKLKEVAWDENGRVIAWQFVKEEDTPKGGDPPNLSGECHAQD